MVFRACELEDGEACWLLSTWYMGNKEKFRAGPRGEVKVHGFLLSVHAFFGDTCFAVLRQCSSRSVANMKETLIASRSFYAFVFGNPKVYCSED